MSTRANVRASVQVQGSVQEAPPVIVPIEGAQVVEFFGIPLEGAQNVVFVLDCSGSMANLAQGRLAQINVSAPPPPVAPVPADPNSPPPDPSAQPAITQPRKIDVAQAELVNALAQLPAGTRMNVVFFSSDMEAFAPAMVPLEDASRAGLISFVRQTVAAGSTALAPAMRAAFLMNAQRIVLLSDGLGNTGGNSDELIRDAREAMRGGVRIDTIGLGYEQDGGLLSTLSSESGGLYQAL